MGSRGVAGFLGNVVDATGAAPRSGAPAKPPAAALAAGSATATENDTSDREAPRPVVVCCFGHG